jgi:S-adenosylmethionine synthetase
MKLLIKNDYKNPEDNYLEIVERKGMGHPDTLADKLAEECSRVYSEYCINKYGFILHHNIDKLYIGAGLFLLENGKIVGKHKIRIDLNGRVSNTMDGEKIDLENMFTKVIKNYLHHVMPRINVDKDLNININCTQYSKREYWYTPRNANDVPDVKKLFAADTSLCVSHGGLTFCEDLAISLEQSFWIYDGIYPTPKYNDIGQDIKVMVSRINDDVTATICLPVYKDIYNTEEEYVSIVKKYENILMEVALKVYNPKKYKINIEINRNPDNSYRNYSLVKGSCIECGEEGIVGRGNNSQGLISSFREHTMEASCGKNLQYHIGRVVSFMANNAVKRINEELGIKSTLFCLTRNRGSLFEPFVFYLSTNKSGNEEEINKIINEEFNKGYLKKIVMPQKLV